MRIPKTHVRNGLHKGRNLFTFPSQEQTYWEHIGHASKWLNQGSGVLGATGTPLPLATSASSAATMVPPSCRLALESYPHASKEVALFPSAPKAPNPRNTQRSGKMKASECGEFPFMHWTVHCFRAWEWLSEFSHGVKIQNICQLHSMSCRCFV